MSMKKPSGGKGQTNKVITKDPASPGYSQSQVPRNLSQGGKKK